MQKTALITGISGQDGFYLTQLLLEKNYRVIGIDRSTKNTNQHPSVQIEVLDLITDSKRLLELIEAYKPDEIYNLASKSFVDAEWKKKVGKDDVFLNGVLPLKILDLIGKLGSIKFLQASSAQMYGSPVCMPQCEETSFRPKTSYGKAKLTAHNAVQTYREGLGVFAVSAILFNHESIKRPDQYVTRKVTKAVASISKGQQDTLVLGDLRAARDWGYAPDFVKGMWLALQQEQPTDYVFGTGKTNTVLDLCDIAFRRAGLKWKDHVKIDQSLVRPGEGLDLKADITKAKTLLGWSPSIEFKTMVEEMVDYDLSLLS